MTESITDVSPELIDDRALESAKDDRLGHEAFAEELAWLVRSSPAPANVALYGRWGSGKSGLANLLRERLAGESVPRKDRLRFVRFDAFKWVETPLRRQFLSQVADELHVSGREYTRDLYSSRTRKEIDLPGVEWLKLLGWFAVFLGSIAMVVTAVIAGLAAITSGPFSENLSRYASEALSAAPAPAVLLAALLTLAGKGLHTTRTVEAPSSDEEFERRFKTLVDTDDSRLVIFVDELDRCSSGEVVGTLETIKTFLEVPNCVFIVAADQRVLERALTMKARQETPPDRANPYYSAGSAYLDKIFQYQVSLPPLRPRKLTGFAIELIEGRSGVWSELDDVEHVISVLVPTHVRSPRRVKVLLNNFVLAWRLAERRVEAGILGGDLRDRAPELAKVVCLRSEFPLFAGDLVQDARLVGLVEQLAANPRATISATVPAETQRLARAYARGLLPVDQHLSDRESVETKATPSPATGDAATGTESAEDATTSGTVESSAASSEEVGRELDDVSRKHSQQLIRYLQKTAHIPGPGRDLLFLEGSGAVFGLDPSLAGQLEDDATDGRTQAVADLVAEMEAEMQVAALRLLAHHAREASFGEEGRNAVGALLHAVSVVPMQLVDDVAGELAGAVATQQRQYSLRPDDLYGAYLLGLQSGRSTGHDLLENVLARSECLTDADLGRLVTKTSGNLLDRHPSRIREIAAAHLSDPDGCRAQAELMAKLEEDVVERLLAGEEMSSFVVENLEALIELAKRQEAASEQQGNGQESETEVPPTRSASEVVGVVLDTMTPDRRSGAALFAASAVKVDTKEIRGVVEERLPSLSPISDVSVMERLLSAARRRHPSRWERWMDAFDLEAVDGDVLSEPAGLMLLRLWEQMSGDKPANDQQFSVASAALVRLSSAGAELDDGRVRSKVVDSLAVPVQNAQQATTQDQAFSRAKRFVEEGLIDGSPVADKMLDQLSTVLQLSSGTAQASVQALTEHVQGWVAWASDHASQDGLNSFLATAESWPWIPSPTREVVQLHATAALRESGADISSPLDPPALRQLVEAHEQDATGLVHIWLSSFAEDPSAVWHVVEPFVTSKLPNEVFESLDQYQRGLQPEARFELCEAALRRLLETPAHPSFFAAAGLGEADHDAVAHLLIDLYEQASNNDQRERVLDAWKAARIVNEQTRRELVEGIYLPLARHGRGGVDLAMKHLDLVVPPPKGVKREVPRTLKEAVETAVNDSSVQRRYERKLVNADLLRRKGFFRRRTELREDDET